jgi:hypothetical protein
VQPHFLSNEFLAAGLQFKKEEMIRLNGSLRMAR